MKRPLILILTSILISATVFFSSCAIDSIDALSTFTFKLPLLFDSDHYDKAAPDTSWDFTHLEDYKGYRDNKGRINEAKIIHFNYWIDNMEFVLDGETVVFNPDSSHTVEFEFIKYYLQFAKLKANPPKPLDLRDSSNYEPDPDPSAGPYLLGEFRDVNIAEYYRNPEHIIVVPEKTALIISEALKNIPFFFTITEYSKAKINGVEVPDAFFPLILARYDMFIRFNVDL